MRKMLCVAVTSMRVLFADCNSPALTPVASPNPWQDDYSFLSSMDNYRSWGTYNIHNSSCHKLGGYYYIYSTDTILGENRQEAEERNVPLGYIQVRRSKDLVKWEFVGWAFPEIPQETVEWARSHAGGRGATNIWAPYIIPFDDKYRLYYCVSAFGRKTSYIGMAEAASPGGPWTQRDCVVKTNEASVMNVIDPSIMTDPVTGKWRIHYGSLFGGLCCVELDPETGLPVEERDRRHLTARRVNYQKDNLEAPEIICNLDLKQYYLLVSYDPLMTTYNVRVGCSDKAGGPFVDFSDVELENTTNNFPILTAPYRFHNHPGWAGTAHCSVFTSDEGQYFMAHQGHLSPHNQMMDLHLRQVFFTPDEWPVVLPERYTGSVSRKFSVEDMVGKWKVIRIQEPAYERHLQAGRILWGEGQLKEEEWNVSHLLSLGENGYLGENKGNREFLEAKQLLSLILEGEIINNLIIFAGHDWENEKETVLFTGLDSRGGSIWGKRTK